MRKFTILLAMAFISTIVFGQYATQKKELRRDLSSFGSKQNINYSVSTKSAVWSNDFSNATDWTLGSDPASDGSTWAVCTYSTAPVGWIPVYGMSGTFASATVDNGFALFNSDSQGASAAPGQNSWIQLANPMDLSTVNYPRFIFTTYYKKWEDIVYFEYSTNGGTSWESEELFTFVNQKDITATDYIYILNVPELANQSNVLIRFRFTGDWDYGIFIDDISVVECPAYDLTLSATAVNFFQAEDYSISENSYHPSSHLGMIPYTVATNPSSFIVFNTIVKNNGSSNATPVVDVTITDPDATEVYNFTFTSDIELVPGAIDTLDIAWQDGQEFYITEDLFKLGQFDVDYELSVSGQTDGSPEDNAYSTYFIATDNVYAKDGNNLDGYTGPGIWLNGGQDGDMLAVDYLLYEATTIDSVQTFITSNSDTGTSLIANVLIYDTGNGTWETLSSSQSLTVEAGHLGSWVSFTFPDPATVSPINAGEPFFVKIALEFSYAGSDLWIGEDNTVPASYYSTNWKLQGETDWTTYTNYTNASPMLRACLPVVGVSANEEVAANISIYPNPSTGIIKINNAEGATIEVLNLMGQVVKTVENASAINNIDLSNNANGTYFVRVVKGNEVSTTKINIVK